MMICYCAYHHIFSIKIDISIQYTIISYIMMLILDLLNILFDQCNYQNLITMRSLNKRQTNYANKYSSLRYYNNKKCNAKEICRQCCMKTIKHIAHEISNDKALKWCAGIGYPEVIKYLVSIGANIRAHNDVVVCKGASSGNISTVKYSISIGANINAYNDRALQLSASNDHLEVVKYLVSVGANIHADNDFALQWTASNGQLEVVKYLVSIGANVNGHDGSALRWSARYGHLEVVKYLVSIGANVHARDAN